MKAVPLPILPLVDTADERTRVVHGIGVAVLVRRDASGFLFRKTFHAKETE